MLNSSFRNILNKVEKGYTINVCTSQLTPMQRKAIILIALFASNPKKTLFKVWCIIIGCGFTFALPLILFLLAFF